MTKVADSTASEQRDRLGLSPEKERELVRMIASKLSDFEWSSTLADEAAHEILETIILKLSPDDLAQPSDKRS